MKRALVVLLLAGCSAGGGKDAGEPMLPCPYSTARTGVGSCQVNLECPMTDAGVIDAGPADAGKADGGADAGVPLTGPKAMYCSGQADGGASCVCKVGAATEATFEDGELCGKEGKQRALAAGEKCGWLQ